MRQRKRNTARVPANDNARSRIGAAVENMDPVGSGVHVYVGTTETGVESQPEEGARTPIRKAWQPTRITTNLPEKLPILPEEVALIRGFMGELLCQILANDIEAI